MNVRRMRGALALMGAVAVAACGNAGAEATDGESFVSVLDPGVSEAIGATLEGESAGVDGSAEPVGASVWVVGGRTAAAVSSSSRARISSTVSRLLRRSMGGF